MSWGHFRQNRRKIEGIESRVKKDGKMPKPTATPPDKDIQKKTVTQYLNGVIQKGKEEVFADKVEFYNRPLTEVHKVDGALPIDARGETILAEQKKSVKILAQGERWFFEHHNLAQKEFRQQHHSLESKYFIAMENWGRNEKGNNENDGK